MRSFGVYQYRGCVTVVQLECLGWTPWLLFLPGSCVLMKEVMGRGSTIAPPTLQPSNIVLSEGEEL